MSNTRQLWYPRPPTYATVRVELNGSSRWRERFQFHRIGEYRFLASEVTVNGGATVGFSATPGLSTVEAKPFSDAGHELCLAIEAAPCPFIAMVTDLHRRSELAIASGPVRPGRRTEGDA